MKWRRRRVLVWAGAAIAGCSFQPVEVESRKELIAQLPAEIPKAATLPATLLVMPVSANAAYDTPRMAYSTVPNELAYYAHSEWAEKPAQMLHDLIVRTLDRTGRFRSVAVAPYTGHVDETLAVDLLELRQDFTAEPAVLRMALRANLRDAKGASLAARELVEREPLAEKSPRGGTQAANAAAARLVADLARFVIEASR